MKITLPEGASNILEVLMRHGYEAYVVGGCVRDSLLGRTPGDWDITTSAAPKEVKQLFRRTVDTGIAHGTVTVLIGREGFEVTTYRVDGDYEDGRHPNNVVFTGELREDLRRRDFTINAMAYNEIDGLVDIFHGVEDLERGVIRCVGSALERFEEDALRMLRAVRFAGQLGFAVEESTRQAIRQQAETIQKISAERIHMELDKLLCSGHPEYLREAYDMGLTKVILPEWDQMVETPQNCEHHFGSVGEHTLCALAQLSRFYMGRFNSIADQIWPEIDKGDRKLHSALAWGLLLHDCGKPLVRETDGSGRDHFPDHARKSGELANKIFARLKFDNATRNLAELLIREHSAKLLPEEKELRKTAGRIGPEHMRPLLLFQCMDVLAQHPDTVKKKEENLIQAARLYDTIVKRGDCMTIAELAVNGNDLIKAGIPRGPGIGRILKQLLDQVLEDPFKNKKELLLRIAVSSIL